ncbi:MAG TPA: ATP-binding protein [Actinomycetota bacterium]
MNETRGEAVLVSVPARAEFLHVVRTVVASVAARHDLTVDAIEDLRIAVDEACAQLLRARGTEVVVEVCAIEDGIETICRTDAEVSMWPPEELPRSLAAQVLRGLTDSVAWELSASGPSVRFGKNGIRATRPAEGGGRPA